MSIPLTILMTLLAVGLVCAVGYRSVGRHRHVRTVLAVGGTLGVVVAVWRSVEGVPAGPFFLTLSVGMAAVALDTARRRRGAVPG